MGSQSKRIKTQLGLGLLDEQPQVHNKMSLLSLKMPNMKVLVAMTSLLSLILGPPIRTNQIEKPLNIEEEPFEGTLV